VQRCDAHEALPGRPARPLVLAARRAAIRADGDVG
jgi:hypothetical protein